MKEALCALAVACGLCCSATAEAQPKRAKMVAQNTTKSRTTDTMSETERAKRAVELAEDARAAFKVGMYAKAIERYEEAYMLSRARAILYNIGRCYQELGNLPQARMHFLRFLAEPLTADEREDAMKKLEEVADQPSPPPIVGIPNEITVVARPEPTRIVIAASATGVFLVAGIATAFVSGTKTDDARAIFDSIKTAADVDAYKSARSEAETWSAVRNTSFVLAGAAAVWSGYEVWRHMNARSDAERRTARPVVWLIPSISDKSSAAITLATRF